MHRLIIHSTLIAAVCFAFLPGPATAADGDFDLGLRAVVVGVVDEVRISG